MSIIYHDVLGTVLKRLLGTKALSDESTIFSRLLGRIPADLETIRKRIRQAISPHEPCLGCRQRDSTAYMVLSVLMEKIQDQEMLAAFANSDGLCLPHLRLGCKLAQDEVALAELLKVELEKLEKLHTELAEFVRKNDYRYIKDGFGPEGNAWRRAAQLAAGGQVNKQDHA
ncbi:MAG: hypothetical protein JXB15_08850 [Anaerolineales bacterium]|nr:hypothetical protein [Anaerolineales bacterium]